MKPTRKPSGFPCPEYLHGMKAYRLGNFNAAIEHFNNAMDYFLYDQMWTLADIKMIQSFRLDCYAKIRESK